MAIGDVNVKVCTRCRGTGTHTNPAIDGNGITASEMDEIDNDDPDFRDNYMNGMYDVVCELCGGKRVIEDSPEADEARAFDAECLAEQRAESRMLGEY